MSNAGNPEAVKEARLKTSDRRDREIDDLRVVMSTVQGRRVINRIMEFCGMFRTSFTGNSYTFFNEGQRNVGLFLYGELQEVPDLYLDMIAEAKKRLQEEKKNV